MGRIVGRWVLFALLSMTALAPVSSAQAAPGASLLNGAAAQGFGAPARPVMASSWRQGKVGTFLSARELALGQSAEGMGPFGVMHQYQSVLGASTGGIITSILIGGAVVVGIVGPVLAMRNHRHYLPWGIVGVSTGGIGVLWTVVLGSGGVNMFWIGLPLFLASVAAIVLGSICIHRWRHRRGRRRYRRRRYRRRRRRYRRRRRSDLSRPSLHHPSDRYFPPVAVHAPLTIPF